MLGSEYAGQANELSNRILELIPKNKQILEMKTPWDLFKLKGFKYNDIGPTLFQASWALRKAQHDYETKLQAATNEC